MSKDDKEAKKEELLEKQEARQLTEEELAQVSGGSPVLSGLVSGGSMLLGVKVNADGIVKASGTIDGQAYAGTNQS